MGSPTVTEAKPITMSDTDRNTFKNLLKKPLQIFRKKIKKPIEAENKEPKPVVRKVTDIEALKLNLEKLCLTKNEDDEFKNFTIKLVEEDKTRLDSNSSEDSGFSEKEDQGDLVNEFEKLDLKEKKKKIVYISRGPVRSRDEKGVVVQPYHQINQVNRQTFTGSQVLITKDQPTPFYDTRQNYNQDGALQMALTELQNNVNNFPANPQEGQIYWLTAQEFLEESLRREAQVKEDILSDFKEIGPVSSVPLVTEFSNYVQELNPIEEFENADNNLDFNDITFDEFQDIQTPILLTPPRSNENQMSPFNSPSPLYNYSSQTNISVASNSDYILSPCRSSPNLSRHDEYEKYQDITQFEDIPVCVIDSEKKRKRSLTMKHFKQMQAELQAGFAKQLCCQPYKSAKGHFKGLFEKLSNEERSELCLKVAGLDVNTAYGVLQHILLSLSSSKEKEALQFALFGLICERIMAQKPLMFVGPLGLNLLKAAALRCPHYPLLTRYVVECVQTVLRTEEGRKVVDCTPVFNEVDINGDNLLHACVRRGDACADVLAELVRRDGAVGAVSGSGVVTTGSGAVMAGSGAVMAGSGAVTTGSGAVMADSGAVMAGTEAGAMGSEVPALFDVHHTDIEGLTPLHVACLTCGVRAAHVLLAHGGHDAWKGDLKSGDTPLHLAVRSPVASLQLVLALFAAAARRHWRAMAHANNRSSTTPLELARLACKSTSRKDYPVEVLAFLKKCR